MKKQQRLLLCNSNSSAIIYSPAAWLDIEKKPFAVIYTHGRGMRGGLVIHMLCIVCNPFSFSLSSTRIANLIMHIFYTLLHALSTLHRLQSEHEAVTCAPSRSTPSSSTPLPTIVVKFAHFFVLFFFLFAVVVNFTPAARGKTLCGFQLTLLNIK